MNRLGLHHWLWILNLIAAVVGVLLIDDTQANYCHQDANKQEQCASYHILLVLFWHIGKILSDYTLINMAATVAIAFFTWSLTQSTRKQWQASNRQADIAEANLTRLNRPFVFPGQLQAIPKINPNNDIFAFDLRLEWKNVGSTPAKDAKFHISWEHFLNDIPDDFGFPEHGKASGVTMYIPAKDSTQSAPMLMDVCVARAAWAKQIRLYLWGWITYEDVFGLFENKKYRTQFCWEMILEGNDPYGKQGQLEWRCTSYPRYSCVDEECEKNPQ